MTEAIKD